MHLGVEIWDSGVEGIRLEDLICNWKRNFMFSLLWLHYVHLTPIALIFYPIVLKLFCLLQKYISLGSSRASGNKS